MSKKNTEELDRLNQKAAVAAAEDAEKLTEADFEPIPEGSLDSEEIVRPSMRYWPEVWKRLRKRKLAVFCMVLMGLLILLAILVPMLSPYPYDQTSLLEARQAPSWAHLFGTDKVGRDVFTRVFMGCRTSLIIGLFGAFLPFVIGMVMGAIAGWFGGIPDMIIMRVVDVMICIPGMIYMILTLVVLGGSPTSMIIAMGVSGWMGSARGFRGRILQFKNREFVLAARTLGTSPARIIFRHILPNILGNMAVGLCASIPGAISMEAGMSYIGLGISPPMTSLGQLCTEGVKYYMTDFHLFIFPAIVLSVIIFALYMFGTCLRDALDPKLRDEDYLAKEFNKERREAKKAAKARRAAEKKEAAV